MRGLLLGFVLLSLAGCGLGGNQAPDPALEAITETPLDTPPAPEAEMPATAAPETAAPEPAPSEPPPAEAGPAPAPPEPPMLARQRAACTESGGQLMPRAPGIMACVRPTRDGGQSCDAASDCEGLCLARSGTCAPLAPLFGCQEVFTSPGRRETLCTE